MGTTPPHHVTEGQDQTWTKRRVPATILSYGPVLPSVDSEVCSGRSTPRPGSYPGSRTSPNPHSSLGPALCPWLSPALCPWLSPALWPWLSPALWPWLSPALWPRPGPVLCPCLFPVLFPCRCPVCRRLRLSLPRLLAATFPRPLVRAPRRHRATPSKRSPDCRLLGCARPLHRLLRLSFPLPIFCLGQWKITFL